MTFWRRRLNRYWRRRRERRDGPVATLVRGWRLVRVAAPPYAGSPYGEAASGLTA